MRKFISIFALISTILMCLSLNAMASDTDHAVYLTKDQSSVESDPIAWTAVSVVAYNSYSSEGNIKASLYRSDGEKYYPLSENIIVPDAYWHYTSEESDTWALFKVRLAVANGKTGCVAGAHVQVPGTEEEWED